MLASVAFVLRHQPDAAALNDVRDTVSSFLGPPPDLPLSEACNAGSIRLLDWIWGSSCTSSAARTASWSLGNYLRSDARYQIWQFNKALAVAVKRGDVAMVEWILSHFSSCPLAVRVVKAAVEGGHLAILKALMAYANESGSRQNEGSEGEDESDNESDVGGHCMRPSRYPGMPLKVRYIRADAITTLGWRVITNAIGNGHADLVQWLYENTIHEPSGRATHVIMRVAMSAKASGQAELLLPEGKTMTDFCPPKRSVEEVERMVENGGLMDQELAVTSVTKLAEDGHFELVKRILLLHFHLLMGNVPVFKWLAEHPTGREICKEIKQNGHELLDATAENGHIEMLQCLYELGFMDDDGQVLMTAIESGPFSSVKWLLEHFTYTERQFRYSVVDMAARVGRLDVLLFLHDFDPSVVERSKQTKRRRLNRMKAWWHRAEGAMEWAAREGHLEVVKWLHTNRPDLCSTSAMDEAAQQGQLAVVQWLHANGFGCTTEAMDRAAESGHLDMLQWLHANRSEGCTNIAMDNAAEHGHLDVVKWLQQNTKAACSCHALNAAAANGDLQMVKWLGVNKRKASTELAMANAVNNGRIRAAYWLSAHFPQYSLAKHASPSWVAKSFEMVLLLHALCPEVFSRGFIEKIPRNRETRKWVDENYTRD